MQRKSFLPWLCIVSWILCFGQARAETVKALPADGFVDSIGVNTHFNYRPTAYYKRFEECRKALRDLGVRHIRDAAVAEQRNPDVLRLYQTLAGDGVRFCLLFFNHGNAGSNVEGPLAAISKRLAPSMDYLEGHNEPDGSWPDKANWAAGSAAWLKELHDRAKADPALAAVPVAGHALAHPYVKASQAAEAALNLNPLIDVANVHAYPGARPNESTVKAYLNYIKPAYDKLRIIVTETGYHTALQNPKGKHLPTSEEAKAIYMPRVLMENFRLGIERSYIYQFVDNMPPNAAEQESQFGLLTDKVEAKPTYHAMKNLIAILRDDGNTQYPTGSLDFSVPGAPKELRTVLLQKKDGVFFLAIWLPLKIWDEIKRTPLPVTATPVTVCFPKPVAGVREYLPNESALPQRALESASEVKLQLDARLVILEIRP